MEVNVAPKVSLARTLFRSDATQRLLAFAGLIILFVVFSLASPYFFTGINLVAIAVATAGNGVLALGVTFVIISGGIDLSIGTVMSLSAVMSAVFITIWGLPVPLGVLAGIATGTVAGLVNGLVIAKMKIPPFIATLGMLYIANGFALIITSLDGSGSVHPLYYPPAAQFGKIAQGTIVPGIDIPNGVWILFGAALVGSFILSRTILGRYTFALGSNEEATRLSGVNVDTWKIAVYTLCGTFAGLAGILIASRLNGAHPETGAGYELRAIAAAVIGGTSLSGGEGTILGTVIGAFIISTLDSGLRILSVPQEWQLVVIGIIVILAVYLDILRRHRAV